MQMAPWTVVIPVKRLEIGKSRLRGDRDDDALVLAIALDTVAAAAAAHNVERVLIVTGDAIVGNAVGSLGADVVAEPHGGGLNAAIDAGAATAGLAVPRAALLADLPALRGTELAAALDAIMGTPGRAYVADHMGTGTTLLGALPGVALDPRFGPGSAAAHAATGATPLRGDWPGLRLDVDTATDLALARRLRLGSRTRAALATDPGGERDLGGSQRDLGESSAIRAVC